MSSRLRQLRQDSFQRVHARRFREVVLEAGLGGSLQILGQCVAAQSRQKRQATAREGGVLIVRRLHHTLGCPHRSQPPDYCL